jgi:uncharacterized protein
VTVEPRVEELLATIRKAIDNDISQLDKAQGQPTSGLGASGSMGSMRVGLAPIESDADQDLSRLRDRVGRQKIDQRVSVAAPVAPPLRPVERVAPRNDGVTSILAGTGDRAQRIPHQLLRPTYADDDVPPEPKYRPLPFIPVPEPEWVEEAAPQQAYYPPPPQGGALMSPQAAYSTQASFQALADTLLGSLGGERHIQEMAQEILRPMLKQWLDDNLPPLVERLVRDEIERVARRGR